MNLQKSPSLPPKTSPAIPWGSPALRPNASFPPINRYTPPQRPPMQNCVRSLGPGMNPMMMKTGSPQMRMPSLGSFRTPQPQPPQHSPSTPKAPWSDTRGHRDKRFQNHRFQNDSLCDRPRDSPSVNPGGSDDILNYYSQAMMADPWLHNPPQSMDSWKAC